MPSLISALIAVVINQEWKVVDALLGRDLFQTADDGQQGGQLGPTLRQYHEVVTAGELLYVPGNSLHQVRFLRSTAPLPQLPSTAPLRNGQSPCKSHVRPSVRPLHQVRNVGFTVALAGNFISRGNLGSVRAELRSDKQSGRYASTAFPQPFHSPFPQQTTFGRTSEAAGTTSRLHPLPHTLPFHGSHPPSLPRGRYYALTLLSKAHPPFHTLPHRYYTQIQQTVLAAGFNATVDVDAGDLAWAQYKQQWRHFEQQEGAAAAAPGAGRDKASVDVDSAVLVSGAGSEEANGCYTYDGTYNEHTQYAKREAGRAFELFHVGDSWWNIVEAHDGGDGGYTTYYGFHGSASQALPLESAAGGGAQDGASSRGWANYKPAKWRGAEPPPTVALSREGCTAAGARPVVRSFVRSWPDTP